MITNNNERNSAKSETTVKIRRGKMFGILDGIVALFAATPCCDSGWKQTWIRNIFFSYVSHLSGSCPLRIGFNINVFSV